MQDRFLYLTFTDPNAFIYTTFAEYDPKVGKPEPFNVEIPSYQAINYEYINNELQWLITRSSVKYTQLGAELNGYIYTIYGSEWGCSLSKVYPLLK